MEMEQMITRLLAEMKADREEMTARLEAKIEANQAKMDANLRKMKAKMNRQHVRMEAAIHSMTAWRKETTARQETTEACLVITEPNSLEIVSDVEHEEVPNEEATVKPVRALKKQHRGRHIAAGGSGKPKKRTQGNGGCQKKLAPARRRMTRRARVAWRKGHGRDNVARRTQRG
jgi:hypothetical protein